MKDADVSISKNVHTSQGKLFSENSEKTDSIEKVFDLVLGRKPTSHEKAYYKYNDIPLDEIERTLLIGKEHNELIKGGRMYCELEKEVGVFKSTILKLQSSVEDKSKEISELTKLLNEKNQLIVQLRELKDAPYVTEKFSTSIESGTSKITTSNEYKKIKNGKNSLWDKILDIFFDRN